MTGRTGRFHVKEYEERVKEQNRRIKSELTYCQDLLLFIKADIKDANEFVHNIKHSDVQIYVRDVVDRRKEKRNSLYKILNH